MHFLAFGLLILAFFAALSGAGRALLRLLSAPQGSADVAALRFAGLCNLLLTAALTLASLFLLYALAANDFSLVYVASYTDRTLPLFYRLTAFWAGQAGSLLFWALSVALCEALFQSTRSWLELSNRTRLWHQLFSLSIMAFFGLLLLTWNNPFLAYATPLADGNGLNPLLQNPGMIFHPPLLFLGYGGFVVPGCLALAQTLSDETDARPWPLVAQPFTLSAWAFLTAGIALGGWWAYMELGWGGYWAWDPVENASLIPWLVGTAALHTLVIQNRRDKLHGTNVLLMALTTVTAFFATYLVRSGVVQSVHAFGQSGVAVPLLIFILAGCALAIWAGRVAHRKQAGEELSGLASREGLLAVSVWLLLALAIIILVATLWPVFSVFWQETVLGLNIDPSSRLDAAGHDHGAVGLTAGFYNRVCLPLFAGLIVLLALCPWFGWRGLPRHRARLGIIAGLMLGAGIALWMAGYRHPVALLGSAAAVGALAGMGLLLADRATWQRPRFAAICGIHLGLALVALGIAFSGPYKLEREVLLSQNETVRVGSFDVRLTNIYTGRGPGYEFLEAELDVSRNGTPLGVASPQRRIYPRWGKMQFAEAATIPSLGNEFYATLLTVDAENRVMLSLNSTPLVNWMWIGSALMSLLPFVLLRRRGGGSAGAAEARPDPAPVKPSRARKGA